MKYFIGFIIGVAVTALLAWKLSEALSRDADLQISFTNLISLSAIQNGLNEGKIEEVKDYVRKMAEYEESNILNNQNHAVLSSTKEKVFQVVSKSKTAE